VASWLEVVSIQVKMELETKTFDVGTWRAVVEGRPNLAHHPSVLPTSFCPATHRWVWLFWEEGSHLLCVPPLRTPPHVLQTLYQTRQRLCRPS
jgi:hypothetical protein